MLSGRIAPWKSEPAVTRKPRSRAIFSTRLQWSIWRWVVGLDPVDPELLPFVHQRAEPAPGYEEREGWATTARPPASSRPAGLAQLEAILALVEGPAFREILVECFLPRPDGLALDQECGDMRPARRPSPCHRPELLHRRREPRVAHLPEYAAVPLVARVKSRPRMASSSPSRRPRRRPRRWNSPGPNAISISTPRIRRREVAAAADSASGAHDRIVVGEGQGRQPASRGPGPRARKANSSRRSWSSGCEDQSRSSPKRPLAFEDSNHANHRGQYAASGPH